MRATTLLLFSLFFARAAEGFLSSSPLGHKHGKLAFGEEINQRCIDCQRKPLHQLHALTPIGPFCPFRSSAALDLDPRMEQLNAVAPNFTDEFARIQLDMELGNEPDPDRLRRVADGIDQSVDQWETLIARLRLSADFQTREYAKLTEAHLATHGVTVESIRSMMKWQGGCFRAMADNTPPPMPPPDLDLEAMMQQAMENQDRPQPSITAMQAAEAITSNPFDPSQLESDTVKAEYKKLVLDHSNLIEFGANYQSFDPLGKLAYLDEIDKIEERWDSFFFRFKLMDAIDKTFKQQCDQFLQSMSMDENGYRDLLRRSHQLMREEAERERNSQNLG